MLRRGEWKLVTHRARRLLAPLVFGMFVVLPLELHLWVLGWAIDGRVELVKLRSFKFDGVVDQDLWGLSHLWFLQYLFLYICVLAMTSALSQRFRRIRLPSWSWTRWTWITAGLGSAVLVFRPEVVWGFQHSFWPVSSKWVYSGLFFGLGALLAQVDPQLHRLSLAASRMWPAAICASVAAMLLGRWHLEGGENQMANVALALTTGGAATLLTVSMFGSASRLARVPVAIQYLSAASFWVYLVHHPLMGLIHIDLHLLVPDASPVLKTVVAFVTASGVSLLMYEALVRKTVLGRWLGFRWTPPVLEDNLVPFQRSGPPVERSGRKAA